MVRYYLRLRGTDAYRMPHPTAAPSDGMREGTPCGNGSLMANTPNIGAALVWSKLSQRQDVIGTSLYGAAALVIVSALVTSLALAGQPYEPPVSVERIVERYIVNADGSFREIRELTIRIETPQAIASEGARRIAYASSRETVESIEAWIAQPDGTKIIVPPESIRTQDEGTEGGSSEFSDTKYKVIVFPQVRVGSRLYWKYESFVHKPLFAGLFFQDWTFSPLATFRRKNDFMELAALAREHDRSTAALRPGRYQGDGANSALG